MADHLPRPMGVMMAAMKRKLAILTGIALGGLLGTVRAIKVLLGKDRPKS